MPKGFSMESILADEESTDKDEPEEIAKNSSLSSKSEKYAEDEHNKQCADPAEDAQPNCPSTTFITQWAAQCFRHVLVAAGADCSNLGSEQNFDTKMLNSLVLQQPLALSAGSGFPLFQHMQKSKRIRTAFSPAQLVQLEQAFRQSQYLVGSERKQLAKQLMLSETQVKVWFQNRRTKSKRFCGGSFSPSVDADQMDEEESG